jgi:hypothetical protein
MTGNGDRWPSKVTANRESRSMLERFQGDRAVLLGAVGIFSLAMVGSG